MLETFLVKVLFFLIFFDFGLCQTDPTDGDYVKTSSFIIAISILSCEVVILLILTIYFAFRLHKIEKHIALLQPSDVEKNEYIGNKSRATKTYENSEIQNGMGDDASDHYDTTFPNDVNRINANFEGPVSSSNDAIPLKSVSRSVKIMRNRPPIATPRDPPPISPTISPPPPIEKFPNPPKTKYPTPQPVKKDIAILQNQSAVEEMPPTSQEVERETRPVDYVIESQQPPVVPLRNTPTSQVVKSKPGPVNPNIELQPPAIPRRNIRTHSSGTQDTPIYDSLLKEEEENADYEIPLPVKETIAIMHDQESDM